MFQIISDGGCDFSNDEVAQHNISIVPFYISFDHTNYIRVGVDISNDEYFNRLISEKGLFPKTSQPNPQDFVDASAPHLQAGDDVLILTISSKLSGSYNSAALAVHMAKEEYPEQTITVIDTLSGSIAQGLILREAIKMRDAGYSLANTADILRKILQTTRVYFTIDTVEYLRRGGRVGPTTAAVGGILGLRPILHLVEGEIQQLDNVRGKKNALRLIEEGLVHTLKDETENINISIGHIRSEEDALTFKAKTEAALGMTIPNPVTAIGAAIGTHAGPGALAFAYCRKFDSFK